MFMTEGLLATIVGIWTFIYLNDRPDDADWLPAEEKLALSAAIADENLGKAPLDLREVLTNPRVLHCVVIYFLIQASAYGVIFYLPAQVAALLAQNRRLIEIESRHSERNSRALCNLCHFTSLPRLADRTGKHRVVAGAHTLGLRHRHCCFGNQPARAWLSGALRCGGGLHVLSAHFLDFSRPVFGGHCSSQWYCLD